MTMGRDYLFNIIVLLDVPANRRFGLLWLGMLLTVFVSAKVAGECNLFYFAQNCSVLPAFLVPTLPRK